MTMIDIGQFPKINSASQEFQLNWYETKLIYPFRYSEGIHYFIQKDQEWIIDEIAKWVRENHFKEDFPSVIDWKLKVTYQNRIQAIQQFSPAKIVKIPSLNLASWQYFQKLTLSYITTVIV